LTYSLLTHFLFLQTSIPGGYGCGNLTAMGVVLANLPGSADDIVYVLLKELPLATRTRMEAALRVFDHLLLCSRAFYIFSLQLSVDFFLR